MNEREIPFKKILALLCINTLWCIAAMLSICLTCVFCMLTLTDYEPKFTSFAAIFLMACVSTYLTKLTFVKKFGEEKRLLKKYNL